MWVLIALYLQCAGGSRFLPVGVPTGGEFGDHLQSRRVGDLILGHASSGIVSILLARYLDSFEATYLCDPLPRAFSFSLSLWSLYLIVVQA